jgi:hypothetical protein
MLVASGRREPNVGARNGYRRERPNAPDIRTLANPKFVLIKILERASDLKSIC